MQLIFNPKPFTRNQVVVDKYGDELEEYDLILISSNHFFNKKQNAYVVREGNKAISKDPDHKNVDLSFIDPSRITKLGVKDKQEQHDI